MSILPAQKIIIGLNDSKFLLIQRHANKILIHSGEIHHDFVITWNLLSLTQENAEQSKKIYLGFKLKNIVYLVSYRYNAQNTTKCWNQTQYGTHKFELEKTTWSNIIGMPNKLRNPSVIVDHGENNALIFDENIEDKTIEFVSFNEKSGFEYSCIKLK